MTTIEDEILHNYHNNLQYLEKNHFEIYTKVVNLSKAIELGAMKENYTLEFVDNKYFDVLDLQNKQYIYNTNSYTYTDDLVKDMNFDEKSNVFNTLYKNPKILGKVYDYIEDIFIYIEKNNNEDKKFHIIPKYLCLGTLLGMHIPKIIEKLSVKRCFIYEHNLEIFRLSLFITPYYEISEHTTLMFSIFDDDVEFKSKVNKFFNNNFNLNYAIKFTSIQSYEKLFKDIIAMISSSQAIKMDFVRRLNTYSNTIEKITDNNKIINVNKLANIIKDKRIIIVGSGPSFETNINWLYENQDKFVIISVGANLPALLKHKITPDIIIEVHPEADALDTYKDILEEEIKDIIFFGGSQIQNTLLSKFNKDNSFIFFTLVMIKEYLGVQSGTSVGNVSIYLSLLFQPKETYLLGIDFAFSKEGDSHGKSHVHTTKVKNLEAFKVKNTNYMNDDNLFEVKGNLEDKVLTNSLFYAFLEGANSVLNTYDNLLIYNLSNGAFIQNTIGKNISDITIDEVYNKKILRQELKEKLNTISESGMQSQDIFKVKKMIKFIDDLTQENYSDNDIRLYFNQLLANNEIDSAFREMILNYIQIIFHYVDGFLNNSSFSYKQKNKHISRLDKLLYENLIKLAIDYKKILEKSL